MRLKYDDGAQLLEDVRHGMPVLSFFFPDTSTSNNGPCESEGACSMVVQQNGAVQCLAEQWTDWARMLIRVAWSLAASPAQRLVSPAESLLLRVRMREDQSLVSSSCFSLAAVMASLNRRDLRQSLLCEQPVPGRLADECLAVIFMLTPSCVRVCVRAARPIG